MNKYSPELKFKLNFYINGINPENKLITFALQYHLRSFGGCGSTLTLHGFFILDLLIPINAPNKTSGEEQHNHNISTINIVLNGTAAVEPSYHKNKSIIKKIEKAKLGYKTAVRIAL